MLLFEIMIVSTLICTIPATFAILFYATIGNFLIFVHFFRLDTLKKIMLYLISFILDFDLTNLRL